MRATSYSEKLTAEDMQHLFSADRLLWAVTRRRVRTVANLR